MENERPLGWTTLEEAKLLVEAGLDPNTADMSYNFCVCKIFNGNPLEDWLLQPFSPDENQPHKQLPCWSIGALENLIPLTIKINDAWFHYHSSFGIKGWSCTYEDIVFHRHLYYDEFKNQIEMLVKLIRILLQDNYIKRHE